MEDKLILKNGYISRSNRTNIELDIIKCTKNCKNESEIQKFLKYLKF